MGRGRAKAKQTKVARELKYFSPETDLDRLRAELSGAASGAGNGHRAANDVEDVNDEDALDDDAADDDQDWSPNR